MALTPEVHSSGDSSFHKVWEGWCDSGFSMVVTVTETPAATGDGMSLRGGTTVGSTHDTGIAPKDHSWSETRTLYFVSASAGGPVSDTVWNSAPGGGNTPGAGQSRVVSIYVGMPSGNPTTWTLASCTVVQNGVTVPEGLGRPSSQVGSIIGA